jgi:pimeloyl-ACP methyl ester carboxylesterase
MKTIFAAGLVISVLLCTGCATNDPYRFNIDYDGNPAVFTENSGVRGELIDSFPAGRGQPGNKMIQFFSSPVLKKQIGTERFKQIQKNIADSFPDGNIPDYAVRFFRLHYWTRDYAGRPVAVSALLLVPVMDTGSVFPLVEMNHATELWPYAGPSNLNFSESAWAYLTASSGEAVLLPDYPGYGDSASFHPYVQSDALGYACRDALAAALQFFDCSSESVGKFSGHVALAGYSEGGYAVLAAIKELNNTPVKGMQLDIAVPMAAPADISGKMVNSIISSTDYPHPFYPLYLLLGWRDIDQKLLAPQHIFEPHVIQNILPLLDGYHTQKEIDGAIKDYLQGRSMLNLFSDDMKSWLTEPGKTENGKLLLRILKANDLLSVAVPENTRIIIVASPADDSVPFSIAQELLENMRKEKIDAELISVPPLTHDDAFLDAWSVAFYQIHQTWMH